MKRNYQSEVQKRQAKRRKTAEAARNPQRLNSWLTRPETSKADEQDVSIRETESIPSTCLLCSLCFALFKFGVKRCHGSRD